MDVQTLALPPNRFDIAIVAFVLFHLPHPERCLREVSRVLVPEGAVGTVTWAMEQMPPASAMWDEQLKAAGAQTIELPATDSRSACDTPSMMTALLDRAGFVAIRTWTASLKPRRRADEHTSGADKGLNNDAPVTVIRIQRFLMRPLWVAILQEGRL